MQKFFSNTIQSKFIKSLLYNTYLPIYTSVNDNDFVVEGAYYIYKSRVIRCTKSGYLGNRFYNIKANLELELGKKQESFDNLQYKIDMGLELNRYEQELYNYLKDVELPYLYAETSYAQEPAKFVVVANYYFGQQIPKFTQRYVSKYDYYDSETHEVLGDYLRCYRDFFDIDLMPFYNCNSEHYTSNYVIKDEYVVEEYASDFKTLCIPIKFNKKYTIAADCAGKVTIAPIFLSKTGTVYGSINGSGEDISNYVYKNIKDSIQVVKGLTFTSPITYILNNRVADLQKYERNLYMLVQLPNTNNSSVVVLEGDYTDKTKYIYDVSVLDELCPAEMNKYMLSKLSLLQLNVYDSYAFSDRLIEYLLLNVVDDRDEISYNVIRTQEYLNKDSNSLTRGVWNRYMRKLCYDFYDQVPVTNKIDINGFVDRDMEYHLRRKDLYAIE